MPMSAGGQKETFNAIIEETLGEDCAYEVVRNIHEKLQVFVNLVGGVKHFLIVQGASRNIISSVYQQNMRTATALGRGPGIGW